MKITCDKVQEDIATEVELSDGVKKHLVHCDSCGRMYEEYRMLETLVHNAGFMPPSGFADKVMSRINAAETVETALPWPRRMLENILTGRAAQVSALCVGGAVSIAGLIRFAFFVLIPT
jgi:short-subunit dehydrogenase involved in D-alanine esterification of teichoic acids